MCGVRELPGISLQSVRAAELGDIDAQYELEMYYMSGVAVDVDFVKAAEHGHTRAEYMYGSCYFVGYGVEHDYENISYLNLIFEISNM